MNASPCPPASEHRDAPARCWALVACAGAGTRAGRGERPKQYRNLLGRPLVMHTLAAFASVSRLAGGVLAVAPQDSFFDERPLPRGWSVARCGGETRARSVANGLRALAELGAAPHDWALVHDAARCLLTPALIEKLLERCLLDPVGGLLALPVADTLKAGEGGRVQRTEDRSGRWLAQTPQMFRLELLQRALLAGGESVTDEASAVEALGLQPLLVPGSSHNFKVTWPEDFALAEALLGLRVGTTPAGSASSPLPNPPDRQAETSCAAVANQKVRT